MTREQAVAAGADPSVEWNAAPDGVVEVDMNGNIVWEWWSLDHVVQDKNPDWPNYGVFSEHPERFNLNWGSGVTGDFTHQNALDYNRTLDQIVVNNDRMGELYVIDHGGTFVVGDFEASKALAAGPKGDILFRWGHPCYTVPVKRRAITLTAMRPPKAIGCCFTIMTRSGSRKVCPEKATS